MRLIVIKVTCSYFSQIEKTSLQICISNTITCNVNITMKLFVRKKKLFWVKFNLHSTLDIDLIF